MQPVDILPGITKFPSHVPSVHFELHAGWTGFMRATGHKNIIPRLQTIVPPNRRLIVQHRLYFNTFDYEGHLKKKIRTYCISITDALQNYCIFMLKALEKMFQIVLYS